MDTVAVKMPEKLKREAEEASEEMGYTGLSEFVRDAVREQIEERLQLKRDIALRAEELREKNQEEETLSTEEVKKMFDLE